MSYTTTLTATESFTLTHAKYLCSKVTADMLRCLQLYGRPSEQQINDYGTELAHMLRDGYVEEYEFGFQRESKRLVSWHYRVINGALSNTDDRPGKILSGVDVSSAGLFNFMTFSSAWGKLSSDERARIVSSLPIKRIDGQPPSDGLGYWVDDRSYSSGGVSLGRKTFHLLSQV